MSKLSSSLCVNIVVYCNYLLLMLWFLRSTIKEDRMRQPAFSACKIIRNQKRKRKIFQIESKRKCQWVRRKETKNVETKLKRKFQNWNDMNRKQNVNFSQ